ncbi:MAG TPA: AAA family ATPase, partial [Paludibacteraceae bacterium]|nr:AAA family ATPase [Paludibacteraceae bacterium]
METNTELELAWRCVVQTGTLLFLTGKAGTGKTTFLHQLKTTSPKRMVVLAPTGIAAINAGGVTIHSFFQLPFAPYIPGTEFATDTKYQFNKEKINIIRSLDLLVIDEVSMVRADLLDSVDAILRRYRRTTVPFGGVQLLLIGDLHQLSPVIKEEERRLLEAYYPSSYFFNSKALQKTAYLTIELKQVYRQSEKHFLDLLNQIRDNKATSTTLEELNKRYIPDFIPPAGEEYIRLTTHNHQAQTINDQHLAKISSPAFSYKAQVNGNFPQHAYPADELLTIKEGAQIMFIKNDVSFPKRFYNGKIGKVTHVDEHVIEVQTNDDPEPFSLQKAVWTNAKYVLNKETNEISEDIEGTFEQYPIRLAWAITIHKSQGLTFDKAIIDIASSFAHGQTYVALSRCRTLNGMVLNSPISHRAIIKDAVIHDFVQQSATDAPDESKIAVL